MCALPASLGAGVSNALGAMQLCKRYEAMDGARVVQQRQLASVNSSLTWRINDCASWLLDPPHDYTPALTRVPVHLPDLIPARRWRVP